MNARFASGSRMWLALAVLLTIVILLRGGVLVARRSALADDPDGYRELATNLAEYGIYGHRATDLATGRVSTHPTAFRPPLYPMLLALVGEATRFSPLGVGILHWLTGSVTVVLVYLLSQHSGLGLWGLLAGALVACDPILLNQSTLVMTETVAAFLAVMAWWCLARCAEAPTAGRAIAAGGMFGLAALCRPAFLVWLVAVIVVWLAAHRRSPGRWRAVLAFALTAGAVLAPWVVRNARVLGEPVIATTHGGYTLWLGNNADFYAFLRSSEWGDVWDSRALDDRYNQIKAHFGHDELAADRWAYQQATRCIANQPKMFVYACLVRVGRLWGLVPHQVDPSERTLKCLARWTVGLWYLGVFVLAGLGVWSLGTRIVRSPWLWGVLLCFAFTAVHTVYWSNLRMRAPLVPAVSLAAAAGARWLDCLRRRSRATRCKRGR